MEPDHVKLSPTRIVQIGSAARRVRRRIKAAPRRRLKLKGARK